jgi:alpha-amylase
MMKSLLACTLSLLILNGACRNQAKNSETETPSTTAVQAEKAPPAPDWAKNATIYEVNVRQFSKAGTFKAVTAQLPRLKEMGVDIVWLMPIYPISQKNKKGSLGSPYAIADYTGINPNYGTLADFKELVQRAHGLGMKVILDWVANHTGWDHKWVTAHPDYYTLINGKMTTPVDPGTGKPTDWTDVADLNYDNPALRKAMIESMSYWLQECDIDGFRCDVAGFVPNDFWAELRPALDKIKTVFMLSEWEAEPGHYKSCFNMTYGWGMHTAMKSVAQGARPATVIDSMMALNRQRFPAWYYQMVFTQNHDENTWNGTLNESFRDGADAFIVLSSTLEGMPLVYNGMESNLNKRLAFFEKDSISWGNYAKTDFFKSLLTLKHRNRALWNGLAGGKAVKIPTDADDKVYAFYRQKDNDHVTVILNLSDQPITTRLEGAGYEGTFMEIFSRASTELKPGLSVTLKPWEYRVYTN